MLSFTTEESAIHALEADVTVEAPDPATPAMKCVVFRFSDLHCAYLLRDRFTFQVESQARGGQSRTAEGLYWCSR